MSTIINKRGKIKQGRTLKSKVKFFGGDTDTLTTNPPTGTDPTSSIPTTSTHIFGF